MAGTNNFLTFNPSLTNSESDSTYAADAAVTGGLGTGMATSAMHNKLFHQVSIMSKALANVIAAAGNNASDVDETALTNALLASIVSTFNGRAGTVVPETGDYTAAQVGAVDSADVGAADGVASLDSGGNVPVAQLGHAVLASALGAASGAASLDSSSHVPQAQLANGVQSFNGRTGAVLPASADYTAAQVGAVATGAVGAPSGVASLDGSGQVPAGQLGNVPHGYEFEVRSVITSYGSSPALGSALTAAADTDSYCDFLINDISSGVTYAFEAYLSPSGGTAYAGLWDVTAGALVTDSTVSATASGVFRSSAITLTAGHQYSIALWSSSASYTQNLGMARVVGSL